MEQTLKITNVLSDPTRYYIYQYITKRHQEVTVQEVAENFNIHPNVARLHLSKLEDVNMLASETKKTGKGGRPSRLYRLSDDVIQLHFPFRDYMLLSKVAIQTMISLGEAGKKALFLTGKRFGAEVIEQEKAKRALGEELEFEQKLTILKSAATLAGFYP
jgi:predicted ArsR family transcriptional regulator